MNTNPLVLNNGLPSTLPLSGSSAFAAYASSQITTASSAISSGTFTTFSNSPSFSITPTITGTYKVYCAIPIETDGANTVGICRIFETSALATLLQESQGWSETPNTASDVGSSVFVQSTYTLTAGVTYTFDIQGQARGGGSLTAYGTEASFYMFAEGIGLQSTTLGYYNGYFPSSGSNYWSTTSSSYVNFTPNGSIPSPTQLQSSGLGTVTGAGSSLPGVTFTAPSTGTLDISAMVNLLPADGVITSGIQLFETSTSTVIDIWGNFEGVSLGTDQFQNTLRGFFPVTASTSYTFVIQGKVSSGTLFLGAENSDSCLGFKIKYI